MIRANLLYRNLTVNQLQFWYDAFAFYKNLKLENVYHHVEII